MFSSVGWEQEVAALLIVALAAVWSVRRLRGPRPQAVKLGGSLARGLRRAGK